MRRILLFAAAVAVLAPAARAAADIPRGSDFEPDPLSQPNS